MKIFLFCALFFFFLLTSAYANEIDDVESFFKEYIEAANSYSNNYFEYYTPDAKIIRVVEKADGTTQAVNIPIERYKDEAKKSTALMKLRQYKNKYFNIKITQQGKDYKVAALRMPSTSNYKIPAHFIIGKDQNGNWKIKEESMNTKVQRFLNKD